MRSAAPADAPKPPPSAPSPRAPARAGPAAPPSPAVDAVAPTWGARIFIQVGTYAMADNATKVKSRLDRLGTVEVRGLRIKGTDFYRVRLGPIANIDEAHKLLKSVVANGIADARIVVEPPPGPSASPGRG
jgi:rare lipoprotein A